LAHEQTPLSNDTIDSVLRHRELGRAKVLPPPPRMMYCFLSLAAFSQHIEVELIFYMTLADPPSAKAWWWRWWKFGASRRPASSIAGEA